MPNIYINNQVVGKLERGSKPNTFTFNYGVSDAALAVSLTMPIRNESYVYEGGLHPIFQMNLPEGSLRASIEQNLRKTVPGYDDLVLYEIIGKSQIGRLSLTDNHRITPEKNINEILTYDGAEDLFDHLLTTYMSYSGVSGVQPKVMVRDEEFNKKLSPDGKIVNMGASHIVKAWRKDGYPELAANEFFCLTAAQKSGLLVPAFALSDNQHLLIIDRFDIAEDGSYLGFEDFCVLNGIPTGNKYHGSYEQVVKRIKQFVTPEKQPVALEQFFQSLVLSCCLRNGDAHLKNFGVLYKSPEEDVVLAPTYDIVTTTVYIKEDPMALTLAGSKKFPTAEKLLEFGIQHCDLNKAKAKAIIEKIKDAVTDTKNPLSEYIDDHPSFSIIGNAMLTEWENGQKSLT